MNRREKILSAAVATLAVGFAANHWAVQPALAWYRAVQAETLANEDQIAEAQLLVDHRQSIVAGWRARHGAGLLEDENAARFGAQNSLNAAARASGFKMESVGGGQRVPAATGQSYDLLRLTLAGRGTLAQTQGFLAAIQQAARPWRVERCEIAARDGRKDQLDAALTLSLRIASPQVREKISLPEKTVAWTPPVRPGKMDDEILKARPFLVDRGAPGPVRAATPKTEAPPATAAPPPSPGSDWTLVGLVTRDGVGEALVLHAGAAEAQVVRAGDKVAGGMVERVDGDGLCMLFGQDKRVSQPGLALSGALPAAEIPAGAARPDHASTPGAAVVPAAAPGAKTPVTDADREAILNRLRQQRNRTSN